MVSSLAMVTFKPPSKDRLEAVCRRWKIRELGVFGSFARGDAKADSDVDLLVEYEPGADWRLLDTARLRQELNEMFGRPVDLVRERNITNPYRLSSIRRDRRAPYAA
jgi:predicted nucleotidyltransferase